MIARGKREARRPWLPKKDGAEPERPKYARPYYALSGLASFLIIVTRGDVLRFASHLPLAIIFRAFGAKPMHAFAANLHAFAANLHAFGANLHAFAAKRVGFFGVRGAGAWLLSQPPRAAHFLQANAAPATQRLKAQPAN